MPSATATLNGHTLASTDAYEVVEGNVYFPPESLNKEYFSGPTGTTSACPWKGKASYYTLNVDGTELKDSAWFYPEPLSKATKLKDYVAFYKNKVDIKTDGPLQNTIVR